MRVGIPVWENRISPLFDVARRLLVVDFDPDSETETRHEETLHDTNVTRRAAEVAALRVDVLICGAISQPLEGMLIAAGVRVLPYTCGPVDQVLKAYRSGSLNEPLFLMPGCYAGGRGLRRRRGRGWRQWNR